MMKYYLTIHYKKKFYGMINYSKGVLFAETIPYGNRNNMVIYNGENLAHFNS